MPETVETPSAAPAPEAPAPQPSGFEDAFGALDALGREDGTPEPPSQPPPGDGRVRGPDGKFVSKAEKPPEKKEEPKATETPKPADEIDPSKLKISELAKHYHKLKAEQKEWLKAKDEYEKKLKTPPEWPEKKTYEERLAEQTKALEAERKRLAEYEQELQFTNFTKSQAYKDQYQKPLEQAYHLGEAETASLEIVERKDEEGNVIQKGRDATAADFDTIMRITDSRQAVKAAVQMFGDAAAVVLAHRKTVLEKNSLATQAAEEYRTKGSEREKAIREQQESRTKYATELIGKFMEAAEKKFPVFKIDPNDPKESELLEMGKSQLERVLRGGAPLKDGDKQWTDDEIASHAAAVRLKAMHADRLGHRAWTLAKRVKELEKELEQFKSSRPGNGDGSGRTPPVEEDDPLKKIAALGRER